MIRQGTAAARMLAVANLTPQSCRELRDQVAVFVAASSAHRAIETLTGAGLLHVVRPAERGNPLPGLYTLTRAGERELDRLFMEAHL